MNFQKGTRIIGCVTLCFTRAGSQCPELQVFWGFPKTRSKMRLRGAGTSYVTHCASHTNCVFTPTALNEPQQTDLRAPRSPAGNCAWNFTNGVQTTPFPSVLLVLPSRILCCPSRPTGDTVSVQRLPEPGGLELGAEHHVKRRESTACAQHIANGGNREGTSMYKVI